MNGHRFEKARNEMHFMVWNAYKSDKPKWKTKYLSGKSNVGEKNSKVNSPHN